LGIWRIYDEGILVAQSRYDAGMKMLRRTLQRVFGHDIMPVALILVAGVCLAVGMWLYQNAAISAALSDVRTVAHAPAISVEKRLDLERDLLKMELDGRVAVVQILLGAGVLASLYITYRNMRTAHRTLEVAQQNVRVSTETLLTTQKGQVTERFTRAIGQLGAVVGTGQDERPNLEVRFGGIYGLEGVARDADEYRQRVVEVLSAYVREHAKNLDPSGTGRLSVDLDAILGVFARLRDLYETEVRPDLSGSNLAWARLPSVQLRGANLGRADLTNTNLQRANFWGADLMRANLTSANLTEANLMSANLTIANLRSANLTKANLQGASLRYANLSDARLKVANLVGADFAGATLERANLTGANLTGANLKGANLQGAILKAANLEQAVLLQANFDGADLEMAILPNGFDPVSSTVTMESVEGQDPFHETPIEPPDPASTP